MADFYAQPQEVSDLKLAFPGDLGDLLPPMRDIPDDYPSRQDWTEFQQKWFFGGLPKDVEMHAVDGVNAQIAGRHLSVIQRSFEPRHEHKEAAVAWLASRWFSCVTTRDGSYSCPRGGL